MLKNNLVKMSQLSTILPNTFPEGILKTQTQTFKEKFEVFSMLIKDKIGSIGIEGFPFLKEKKKIDAKLISKLSDEELIKYLQENEIDQINIKNLSSEQLSRLNYILINNFPLVEISRLVPAEKLININISGIKQINDIAGIGFCDLLVEKFKNLLKNQFIKSNSIKNHKGRIVKNDYKNITFVSDSLDPIKSIFGDFKNKDEIIVQLLKIVENDIKNNARNIVLHQADSGLIVLNGQKHLEELIQKKSQEIKNVVINYFDFGVGESTIPYGSDDLEKLDSIRKAEISSRISSKKEKTITLKKYKLENLISNIETALNLENEIIKNYNGKKFDFEGVEYNIITNINGNLSISTELLRYIRKYSEKITPKDLVNNLLEYISCLNNSLDFISPIRGEFKANTLEFIKAKIINAQFKKGFIDVKNLMQNFKGALNKNAFFENINGKKGTKIFIDIKDMGINNLCDFNLRAKQFLRLLNDYNNGKITKKTFEEKQTKLFLEAGKSVTDKFIEIQKRILKNYPNAILSFGGDEIYLFIPELEDNNELQENLTKIINSSNQKARIVISSGEDSEDGRSIFEKLEKLTKINKIIEENIEKQLALSNIKIEGNIPENTFIKFDEYAKSLITNKNFDIDDFAKEFKKLIESHDLIGGFRKNINLGELSGKIKVKFTKLPNNQVEIYLHN